MTPERKKHSDPREHVESLGFQNRRHYLEVALGRNIGLFSAAEQERLCNARVAIPGLGGVGGVHLVTMARMGIGGFRLAEFDVFEPANINRQYGAKIEHFGRPKLDTMVEEALAINPFLDLNLFPEGVNEKNVISFLTGADIVVDGMDFFAFETRRLIFNRAREMGIPVITAGPIGFSAALLVFLPDRGMSFDEYFAIDDGMTLEEKLLAFFVGLAPRATQMRYIDPTRIDMRAQQGPSLAAACQLCASVAATEVVRILLERPGIRAAPHYFQYDPMVRQFHRGYLFKGNRHPLQRFKLKRLKAYWLKSEVPVQIDWQPAPLIPKKSTSLSRPIVDYIIQAAVRAPSGDNCQPWRFRVRKNRMALYLRPEIDRSIFNVDQYASLIACGAAVENMRLAASRFGFEGRVKPFPQPEEPLRVADIHFKAGAGDEDPLQAFIPERHTNRTVYDGRAIKPEVLSALTAETKEFAGVELTLIQDREIRRQIARLAWRADRIRLENRHLHAHFMNMVRFRASEALSRRDGLPLANLEAGKGGDLFLRLTRPWPAMNVCNRLGASRLIARISYNGVMQASALGLVRCRDHVPQDFFEGGRALQRIWLAATRAGLDFQPMAAITLFRLRWQLGQQNTFPPNQRRQLEAIWPVYERLFNADGASMQSHVMLFRIGYGKRVACRTLRRHTDTFVDP
ncbi:MAG: ThiF family adenylyltransferase [Desulfosarcina sp.]|nr:ThiF family adenylyltransferase [Desulfobacterales bacterium]